MDLSKFKICTKIRVRNYEVDWQGIVHNATYLLYFEIGRMEYIKEVGVKINLDSIKNGSKIVLVRNEINYKSSAKFDDLLNVYTRIIFIKNTSFAFEGIIEDDSTKKIVGENVSVHVWLNPKTGRPKTVSNEFRSRIQRFEGGDVSIIHQILST